MFSISLSMDDERRHRFTTWFKAKYGEGDDARTKFIKDTARPGVEPLTKGRVAQLFDPGQPFGERAAKSLGVRLGLGEEFFLRDAGTDDRAKQAMTNLRALQRINPETFDRLLSDIERITEGARAADRVIKTQTKKDYVTSARAAETLGKAGPPPSSERVSPRGRAHRGGMSGLGEFDDIPHVGKQKPAK